jgi:hypothetical protein
MNKSIINRSMIIKSNTTFFIYTIVINDSKIFINKRESLRYLGLFSLAPLSSLRGRRAHSLPFWWSSISTVSWCWPDIMRLQRCIKVSSFINFLSWYQGRIQDLWLVGSWVGEGTGDRLRSPAVHGRALVGDQRGGQSPPEALEFEELQTFIWTTILNQPHHFYQTKKTWLWVLILSDNC